MSWLSLRQVHERAFRNLQVSDLLEYFACGPGNETGADARRIDKLFAAIKAHNHRINPEVAGNIAADHELPVQG